MSMTTTIPRPQKQEHTEKAKYSGLSTVEIRSYLESASRVIAPLWPIKQFAARNPWLGLEDQSFDQVARWLKQKHHIDIYPSQSIFQKAQAQGKIDPHFLEMELRRWLDSQHSDLPAREKESFCRNALQSTSVSPKQLISPAWRRLLDSITQAVTIKQSIPSFQSVSSYVDELYGKQLGRALNHHMIKWCKLYLDEAQSAWSLPHKEDGFYPAWRQLIPYDPAIPASQRKFLRDWPQEFTQALLQALAALQIPESEIQDYFEGHLLALPGWAGMLLWQSQQSSEQGSLLMEYMAARLSLEAALTLPFQPLPKQPKIQTVHLAPLLSAWLTWGEHSAEDWLRMTETEQREHLLFAHQFDETVRKQIWLEAWEQTYADQVSEMMGSSKISSIHFEPEVQFAFCIDVRSEPFRRRLEQAGPFETYGCAGFFGLPIETSELGHGQVHSSLPALLKPRHTIQEFTHDAESELYRQRQIAVHSFGYTFKKMKQNLLTSLLLPEISGPWLSLQMLIRSFVPGSSGRAVRQFRDRWLRKPSTKLTLQCIHSSGSELPVGFSPEEQSQYVLKLLKMMGLTDHFAPLVVICGHGSQSTNNPYAAALDCGACGGVSGGFNARVLAELCNMKSVREALAAEGISIPEETFFTAAEHLTTVDELKWLYVPELSSAAQRSFLQVQEILPEVSHEANSERLSRLPQIRIRKKTNPVLEARRIAEDWSEVRPEWGLAGNAAFIVGRRMITQGCNFEGRAFLHSYNWRQDEDGTLLADIINGPVTVAEWINLQYYASTVAPHYYGSGNKATLTVTSGLGVMQGNGSDLLSGLPFQSVMKSDHEIHHEPLRLLLVIEAPRKRVQRLLDENLSFRQKVNNRWIRLATIDPTGYWESWSSVL